MTSEYMRGYIQATLKERDRVYHTIDSLLEHFSHEETTTPGDRALILHTLETFRHFYKQQKKEARR